MKKINYKVLRIVNLFLFVTVLSFSFKIEALEKSLENSKIYLINQDEEVNIGNGMYSFTFANAKIDPSLVKYSIDESYYLKPDQYEVYSKGSTKSNVISDSLYFYPGYYNDKNYY